jgi:hypothetical protein
MKKVFLVTIIALLAFSLKIYAFVWANDLECLFSENPEKTILSENLVNGSIHFLKSKQYADLLLYEYEKSALPGYNFFPSLDHIEKALYELNSAKTKYREAITIGKRIGYNEAKVNWFKSFDYDSYSTMNNLNAGTAQRVKNYLIKNDVLGIYQHCIDEVDEIVNTLNLMKDKARSGKQPEITLYWRLLQQYAEASLFGNYATMMGGTILGNCDE